MVKIPSLFHTDSSQIPQGVPFKSHILKKQIVSLLSSEPLMTVAELAMALSVSAPTIAKIMAELIDDGYVKEMGKIETAGGRRPNSFALSDDAGYFLGVEIGNNILRFALSDMNGNIVKNLSVDNFETVASPDMLDQIATQIESAIEVFDIDRNTILGQGITIRGRVDSLNGQSHNFLNMGPTPLASMMSQRTGIQTIVENDTRAIAFAEYVINGDNRDENRLFINVDRGIGVGIIIGGKLYYGKSGFSGEFGHIPFFDNQIICHCGKKGCMETEASGAALETAFMRSLEGGGSSILTEKFKSGQRVTFIDIIAAAQKDDVLSIELLGDIGEKLGRGIGVLMNLFNPETVIIGGALSKAGDYLMLPIRTALAKYSLSLVNNDSVLSMSTLGDIGVVVGAALLTRHHIICEVR